MNFESQVIEYIMENVDDKEKPPDSFSIEPPDESVWKTEDNEDVLIDAQWWVEVERDALFGEGTRTTQERDMVFLYPDEDDEIYEPIMNKFEEIRSSIKPNHSNVELSSLSLLPTYKHECADFSPEWADEIVEEFRSTNLVDYNDNIKDPEYTLIREILDSIENNVNDNLKNSDYSEIILNFSDFHHNKLSTVKANIKTQYPHRYYSDVESIDEYCRTLSDDENEFNELMNQNEYEVLRRLDIKDEDINADYIPNMIKQKAETIMSESVNELIDVDGEFILEAESIVINEDSKFISFWIYTQFSDWNNQ